MYVCVRSAHETRARVPRNVHASMHNSCFRAIFRRSKADACLEANWLFETEVHVQASKQRNSMEILWKFYGNSDDDDDDEWMNEWMNEWMKWMHETIGVNEMNEWMDEWVNE